MVVQSHVSQQRLLQILSTVKAVTSQHISNAPIEAFNHTVGAWRSGFGQPVLDAHAGAHLIELVLPRGLPGSRGKEAISELFAVVGEHLLDAHRAGLVHGVQKRLGAGRRLVLLDLHKHPARGPVDGHEQIAPAALVLHLWQVLRKRSGNPSSNAAVMLPLLRLVNQPRRRGEHGSRTGAALPGGGGGVSGFWSEGQRVGRCQWRTRAGAGQLVCTFAALAGTA